MYYACIAAWITWVINLITCITFFMFAAWNDDGRFGGMGFILFMVGLCSLVPLGYWSDVNPPSRPVRLSRAQRRELAEAKAKIRLEQAIFQAEEEAGITR